MEKVPGGWMSVRTRTTDDDETPIDLETLFNAVVSNPAPFEEGGER
jgi:ABC-2 type transport system ATP-binding protein